MFARLTLLATVTMMLLGPAGLSQAEDHDGRRSARLERAFSAAEKAAPSADASVAIWVRFADKGIAEVERHAALTAAAAELSAAALTRRAKEPLTGGLVDEADLPLAAPYLRAVTATGAVPRRQSRWLNAASYNATRAQVTAIADLPFVTAVDVVARGTGSKPKLSAEMPAALQAELDAAGPEKAFGDLDYGPSLPGLAQANIPAAHARGLSGTGVTVALLDTGFEMGHESLQDVDVVATWDFVNDDEYVGFRPDDDPDQTLYGTGSLSALAGFSGSNLIGAAYGASVILAKTENLASETPAEEDNWIAAVEWAEGLGADVVSSGLGYYAWHEFPEMDGQTAPITVAAELAAARGVCVVNATGDLGNSVDWPHLLPPSDGPNVIAVGTVDLNGLVTFFSSGGPTADGRIKPDVMALGAGHPVAVSFRDDLYNFGFGANFAVPLVSGVVALMLEQNPALNPRQIMEALRLTASRAAAPDNAYGWGVIDAVAALNHWAPAISHTPLVDTEGDELNWVTATINDRQGLDPERLFVAWRVAGGTWALAPLNPDGGDQYTARIPGQGLTGQEIEYYIVATNTAGLTSSHPATAPTAVHRFREGADTTLPTVTHLGLPDMIKDHWPPTVTAQAADNLGISEVSVWFDVPGHANQGPVPLLDMGDHYEIAFPVPVEEIFPGFTITYRLLATDAATIPNVTVIGPFTFDIVISKGKVLVVDDRNLSLNAKVGDRPGAELALSPDKSAADLASWLTDAGFTVDVVAGSAVGSASFQGYDAVMVTSGSNFGPYSYQEMRRVMAAWVQNGGKLVVEGGETSYAADVQPGYPELMGTVLPILSYGGDDAATLWTPTEMSEFPLLNRPHRIPNPFVIDNSGGFDYGAADLVEVAPDAIGVLRAGYGSSFGGVVVYDNNTCPDAGQIVYLPLDIKKAGEADGRALLDNAMTYVLTTEPPGTASISGRVILAGQTDHAGVTVRVGSTHSVVTAADGSYTLPGLWGGVYEVLVESSGYAPVSRPVTVVDGAVTDGTDFYLVPVVDIAYPSTPGLSIPDNDPAGVSDTVEVAETGAIYGINIDSDISHFAIGHLTITLTSPAGTTVTLHNRSGGTVDDLVGNWPASLFIDGPGSLDDFLGESAAGTWTLAVTDHQLGAVGTINSWSLNLLVVAEGATAVDDGWPAATRLLGNQPNPFNPRTTIAFALAQPGPVRLEVFDLKGHLVRRLVDRELGAGRHSIVWDGRDGRGGETASGLYFSRLTADRHQETAKMLLIR